MKLILLEGGFELQAARNGKERVWSRRRLRERERERGGGGDGDGGGGGEGGRKGRGGGGGGRGNQKVTKCSRKCVCLKVPTEGYLNR